MKPRKLKPRPKPLLTRKLLYADGPYHDFWLFREGERAYTQYRDLWGRKDAPVRLPDDVTYTLSGALKTVVSMNPSNPDNWRGFGLNPFGPTIINQNGGAAFADVCRKNAQEWAHGPDPLPLSFAFPISGKNRLHKPSHYKVHRDPLVRDLETLADWGDKAATGEFFIMHDGI